MGPSAVDCKLDLTVKAVGNIREFDFPEVVCNLVHLVGCVGGIPGCAVQPSAFTVTNCVYSAVIEAGDFLNDVACYIGVILNGIIHYGKGAGTGKIEGHVLIVLVADPLCAVLHGLELNCLELLGYGVILGVGTVIVLGHEVLFVGAVPCSAENVSGRTCNDVGVLTDGLGCGLSSGSRGGSRSGTLSRLGRGHFAVERDTGRSAEINLSGISAQRTVLDELNLFVGVRR